MTQATALMRFTTRYSPQEDRIFIAGETADGHTHTVWLTQRLLNQVLTHTARWLEQVFSETVPEALTPTPDTHDWLHRLVQHNASAQRDAHTPPVPPHDDVFPQLITEINIKFQKSGLSLWLCRSEHTPLSLTFDAQQLRQWLAILCELYRAADWPLTHCPDWVVNPVPIPEDAVWH